MSEVVRSTLLKVFGVSPQARRIYDVNLRKDSYTSALVQELLAEADVVKLNDAEMDEVGLAAGVGTGTIQEFCRALERQFDLQAVCVTRGAQGCSLLVGDDFAEHSGYAVKVADTVGAGDAFAGALVHGLGQGWSVQKVAEFCNRMGALVAAHRGAIPEWSPEEVFEGQG